jgi:hypothetical protein
MPLRAAIAELVYAAVLGIWLGTIVVSGVAAAVIFPAMRALDPRVPAFSRYDGPHWRIVGGDAANKVFWISDIVQVCCAIVAVIAFAVILNRITPWRLMAFLRLMSLAALLAVLAYRLGFLGPRMNAELLAYWEAARAGDSSGAQVHREAFDRRHPVASGLIGAGAALALVSIGLGALSKLGEERGNC